MDPEVHLQAGTLVGDHPWGDREGLGDQDLDQWVQGDQGGRETGDLLTGGLDPGVQEVQGVQEAGIRARVVSRVRDTLRRRRGLVRAQQREQRRSRKTCLTSAARCG